MAEASLHSPLLDHNLISGARNILLNISVANAEELMYEEVVRILEYIQAHASVEDESGNIHNANIIWGTSEKPQLGNAIELVVVATGFEKNSKCKALVQNIDYAPTILDVAGIAKPDYMVGNSLVPLLKGRIPNEWRSDIYYHYYDFPTQHQVRRHDGVRDNRYKLIHFYDAKKKHLNCDELYDLQKDPNELNNLYGDIKYKKIQDRLQKRLDSYRIELKVDEY